MILTLQPVGCTNASVLERIGSELAPFGEVRIANPKPLPSRPFGHGRSEEHTSELQSRLHLVCRLLLEKKKNTQRGPIDDSNTETVLDRRHVSNTRQV